MDAWEVIEFRIKFTFLDDHHAIDTQVVVSHAISICSQHVSHEFFKFNQIITRQT
jgi:hypothetical protein